MQMTQKHKKKRINDLKTQKKGQKKMRREVNKNESATPHFKNESK